MLGLGRASQYAGWWSSGAINISIPVTTTVSQAAYQTPSFSWQTQDVSLDSNQQSFNGNATARIDLTGYPALTGFNNTRFTQMLSIYINWPGGLSDGTQAGLGSGVNDSTNSQGAGTNINILSGQLSFEWYNFPGGQTTTLTGPYTDWTNKWLTLVFSGAETDSVYTNWSPTGTGTGYYRFAVYDTQEGTLIKKSDYRTTPSNLPDLTTLPTSLPVDFGPDTTNYSFGTLSPNTSSINTANYWYCYGTMWDPVTASATDTTWLTTRPNNTIGTGVAWVNLSYTDVVNYSGSDYGIKRTNDDLYSQAQDAEMVGGAGYFWTAATVTQSQNTTNIPKDKT
jgi:hypothetical protein